MSETKTCPKCGNDLPDNAPSGICPKCLMQAGVQSDSAAEMNPTTLTSGFVPPDPQELAEHFPQLEILELLGKGGMGAVYKARQPGLDRLVAMKILPPEIGADPAFAERFAREARALARLSHQNIVSVFDFGQADGQFYFVMEFVDGTNLRQLIEAGGLKPEEALAIVPQICEALQFAHNEGIVHRDIKPENILIDKQGRVKIADFGLAKLLGKAPADLRLTAAHQVMGTLHYMAPEQMRGSHAVDHRADIYSLGVVFYEMLTGQLPIGKFEPPSKKVQIDVRLDEVVLRSLENEPGRRYQQVSEVKTAVENLTGKPAAPAPGESARNRSVGTIVLGMLIIVLSLMPWGNAGKAGFATQYTTIGRWDLGIVPLETDINAWNSFLALKPTGYAGHWYVRVPNWILPLTALAVLALAVTGTGDGRIARQFGIVGLALFSAALMFLVVTATVFHGYHDPAMLGVFLLFAALFLKSLAELLLALVGDAPLHPAQARWTASWMLISAAVGLLPLFWAGWFFADGSILGVFRSFVIVIGVPTSLIIGAGALRMFARPSSRFARVCNILAMLPCYAGVIIGLPAGIVSLLARREQPRAGSSESVSASGPAERRGSVVQAPAECLIVIACIALLTAIGVSLWLQFVPVASLLQPQTKTTLRMMAVTLAGYAVFMLTAGLLMRRLRVRMLVLLLVTVIGIAVPAMLALNVIMEWGRVPQWPVMIPMWLGVPVALWATVLLFRREVREAFARL